MFSSIPAFVSQSRYGWWSFQVMRWQSPLRRSMSYLTTLMTTDQYAKEVKLFGIGDYFIERYRTTAATYYEVTQNLLVKRNLASFGWGSVAIIASSGTFLYVALLALRGQVSLGSLTVYIQAASQVQGAFQGILSGLQGVYENALYLTTLYELLEEESSIKRPTVAVPVQKLFRQGIEFRNVSYRYAGREEYALQNLSFTIELGETVALVGGNGAGKSTVVKLLGRLYDPSQGQILIDGTDIKEYDPAELHREFGLMFQHYASYQFTVAENIGIGNIEYIDSLSGVTKAAERAVLLPVIVARGIVSDSNCSRNVGSRSARRETELRCIARGVVRVTVSRKCAATASFRAACRHT